jgi:hypothetical protein
MIQIVLDKELDIFDDYLIPPQICGGRTPLPPSTGSSSAAAVAAATAIADAATFV